MPKERTKRNNGAKKSKSTKRPAGKSSTGGRQANATRDTPAAAPTIEEIRSRAYELYLQRGSAADEPMADWLQAERELRERCGLQAVAV